MLENEMFEDKKRSEAIQLEKNRAENRSDTDESIVTGCKEKDVEVLTSSTRTTASNENAAEAGAGKREIDNNEALVTQRTRISGWDKHGCERDYDRPSGNASTTVEKAVAPDPELWIPEQQALHTECRSVIVDLETTGFGRYAEILQVAAKSASDAFSAYMLPEKSIHPKASEKTGFTTFEGQLHYRNKRVSTELSSQVAGKFVRFLESVGPQVILVGHNIVRFDMPLLVKWLQKHELIKAFTNIVYGITDSIPLLKQGKIKKQDELARKYLTDPVWNDKINDSHNAVIDCELLDGLLKHFKIDEDPLRSKCVTIRKYFENRASLHRKKETLTSLSPMQTIVSKYMLEKMAAKGVTLRELEDAYKENGRQGVFDTLSLQVNGKPRVTNTKDILEDVANFIEKTVNARNGPSTS